MASDDDNDLLEEDPFEGEALLLLVLAYCLRTLLQGKLMPIPLHIQGVQHHSHDADPDTASSAAPVPAHSLSLITVLRVILFFHLVLIQTMTLSSYT